MTLPLVDTPLTDRVPLPAPRDARWNPALEPALYRTPGDQGLVARLRAPGALVVTTGQQPGLFTGPGYALTKALSARALARSLEQRWNRPVVPVYWVPGDDHDLHEVGSVSWLNGDGALVTAALPPRDANAPLTPMWRQPLGEAVLPLLDAFEHSFPDEATAASTVAWLRRHYHPEATIAGAYGNALAELLLPFGVVCLDSTHPVVKREAAPLLLRALEEAQPLDAALASRARELGANGRDAGVPVGEGNSLVFVETELGRDRLVLDGKGLQARRSRTSFSTRELAAIAKDDPRRLSGNVLLRPVLESALLPTVAYVAGPGELRYLALTPPIYQLLGVPGQLPVPRWSGFLVEPRVTRTLEKFGATVEELLSDPSGLESRIARQSFPPGTEEAFAALRARIEQGYEPVIVAATAIDPTLERPAGSARERALHALDELARKLVQHARKRQSVELAQLTRMRASLRPDGKPQERVLSLAGFLARYGPSLLEHFAGHIDTWYAHQLEAAPASV